MRCARLEAGGQSCELTAEIAERLAGGGQGDHDLWRAGRILRQRIGQGLAFPDLALESGREFPERALPRLFGDQR